MFSGEEPSLKLIRTQVFSVKLQMAANEPALPPDPGDNVELEGPEESEG